jgi:hypothetical protein
MPGYRKQKQWIYTDTVGKFQKAGSYKRSIKGFNKLKAAWRGKKVRNTWYAGSKGTLHGGRFKRSY